MTKNLSLLIGALPGRGRKGGDDFFSGGGGGGGGGCGGGGGAARQSGVAESGL